MCIHVLLLLSFSRIPGHVFISIHIGYPFRFDCEMIISGAGGAWGDKQLDGRTEGWSNCLGFCPIFSEFVSFAGCWILEREAIRPSLSVRLLDDARHLPRTDQFISIELCTMGAARNTSTGNGSSLCLILPLISVQLEP